MRTDGQTDIQTRQTHMAKLIVAFRNFANAPRNQQMFRSTLVSKICITVVLFITGFQTVANLW